MIGRKGLGVVLLGLVLAADGRAAAPPLTKAFVQTQLQHAARLENQAFEQALAGKFDQALQLDSQALSVRRRWLGEKHPTTQGSLVDVRRWRSFAALPAQQQKDLGEAIRWENLAAQQRRQVRYAEAERSERQAYALRRKVLGEQHPDTGTSCNNVGFCLELQGKFADALPLYQKASEVWRQTLGDRHRYTAGSLGNIAACLNMLGRTNEALALHQKALAINRKELGEDHPDTARCYNNLGLCLWCIGKFVDALPLFRKALRIDQRARGEDHYDTARGYNNVACCLDGQGKHAEALPLFRKALAIKRKTLGEEHPSMALGYQRVANSLVSQGKYAEALPLFQKALQIFRKVRGEDHAETVSACNGLAFCLKEQGKIVEALPLFRHTLRINLRMHGEESAMTAKAYNNMAACLNAQGKYAEALPLHRKAVRIVRTRRGDESSSTVLYMANLAFCLWCLERHHEAAHLWQEAAPLQEVVRASATSAGFDRSRFAVHGTSTRINLAIALARLGMPRSAYRYAEANLARGLLEDLGAGQEDMAAAEASRLEKLDERLEPLLGRADLNAAQRGLHDELLRQRREVLAGRSRRLAAAAQRLLLGVDAIQRHIPVDAALVLWLDAPKMREHWGCVLRRNGPSVWQRLEGTGPNGAWTEEDHSLHWRLYRALADPGSRNVEDLAAQMRRQRLLPLLPHLRARGDLPAVRRLFVVPTGRMARVPVEVLSEEHAVSYVPSGSIFARLRQQHRPLRATSLLALGDPVFEVPSPNQPEPPAQGILLVAVLPSGNAARAGLRSGDVLLRWGQDRLTSLADLKKASGPGRVRVWRDGKEFDVRLEGTALGVSVDRRSPADAIRARRQLDSLLAKRGTGHRPLPGTRWEVEALARLVSGTTMLTGSRASEQQLDLLNGHTGLKRYRVLHFATHGQTVKNDPDRSALILAQDTLPDPLSQARLGQKVYDGRLTVKTIRQHWQLDADLVVLSACQTALGQDAAGEGLLGFAQALLSRGARSVVLSRWKVDDSATALLMLRFYENLLGKRQGLKAPLLRAEALDEAKRWLRALPRQKAAGLVTTLTGGVIRGTVDDALRTKVSRKATLPAGERPFAHPYYWAAFVFVGEHE
jgi:tetratricopeptide (TPR) repeat protein